ncbi:carbonic anhydrase 2-like [Odontomachus brunneus]|uniref:carbonic anhydrase 2-like n=1 Tax=Odontomachus brunneus TaxID=486640 RepID=UPI0013F28CF2|nr:carbonic anhydrase 2-like [Odontomachus brunneus]
MVLTTAPLGLLLLAGFCLSQHFGYDENDGPSTWPENFPMCSGKNQSPININDKTVKTENMPPLEICGPNKKYSMTVVNNGHTIMLKSSESSDNLPRAMGGPLGNSTFRFEQLHFHWGKDDSEGSETTINNRSFPMEMHAVFVNEKYETMDNALNYPDGLTVLGYLFDVSSSNKILEPIVKVSRVLDEKEEKISKFDLPALLKPNSGYYTYAGSLTTPPCTEAVIWIVFKMPKYLSRNQLSAFRMIKTSDGNDMTHNFRPPQPLNDRLVRQNIPKRRNSGQCSKRLPSPWMAMQTILGIFLFAV